MHLAVGAKLSCVTEGCCLQWLMRQFQDQRKAYHLFCLRKSSSALSDVLPNITSMIAAWENSFAPPFDFPKEDEHNLWNQFL